MGGALMDPGHPDVTALLLSAISLADGCFAVHPANAHCAPVRAHNAITESNLRPPQVRVCGGTLTFTSYE